MYLFFYFIFPSICFAENYFEESFENFNLDKWIYYCDYSYDSPNNRSLCDINDSKIVYENSSINLSTYNADFPVVISKNNIIPSDGDFHIRIKFRYPSVTHRGVGLGIGFTGPYGKLFSQFGIWNDTSSGNNFKFYYNDFSSSPLQGNCSNFTLSTDDLIGRNTLSNLSLTNNYWHYFDVIKINDFYYVYVDLVYGFNTPIYTTEIKNNCIPKIIWFGNFISDAGGKWTTFSLDNIEVRRGIIPSLTPTLTSTPTPTLIPTSTPVPTLIPTSTPIPTLTPVPTLTPIPTPTAVPTPIIRKKKIFILPGLGASWNSEAIVYGKNVNDNDWKMTPMVNNYDGLIEMLDKNDLKKDEDYFVWNYDWRRPIEEIKSKFDIFIKSKNLNRNDDIYLIGHSLGGLVVRLWAQDNNDNENIKQIISLGSPNLGSLDSYSVWNGGEILKYDGISSVAFQILLGLQNKGFVLTDIDKIRNFAPISKDLLPTFDYVSKNNQIIPWKNLRYFNDYLDDKNRFVSSVSSKLFSFGGIGLSTPNNLRLGGRSIYDKVLNLWPDGEILSIKKGNGDETVLKESSLFGTNNFIELNSDHKEITTKSINQLTDQLGLERQPIEFVYHDNFKNNLIVFIGSPSKAELKCGNEIYQENNGFIIAKNKNYRDCDLNLFPTDNGLVHIIAGNTNQNQWNYFEKEVKLGINNSVKILFKDGSISNDKKNLSFLKDQIENDLKTLGLLKAIKFLDKNDLEKIALVVFEYRNKNEERIISQRILDNLFYLSRVISKNKNNYNYKNLEKYVNFINLMTDLKSKRGKLNENSALSLVLLENLKDKVKKDLNNKVYSSVSMITILSSGYGLEAIK